ncbi:unnamed protein product [Thelazia callipaeda]|uniref:Protein kinase domain-containing protein n=1 Tax=Thelazia callipaeda TaxID=103827 RepID=A0A0N5CYB1_THECL|nr:unnamed protein product [Thelazia callipaeda]
MAMIMDINSSNRLQASNFLSPKAVSFHGCEASTSDNLHELSSGIYDADSGFIDRISPAPFVSSICSKILGNKVEKGKSSWGCKMAVRGNYQHSHWSSGQTSCSFLKMALKRLYARDDFEVLECLGEGFFGDVYKVQHRITKEVMVLKIGKERGNRRRAKTNVLKEIGVLNQLTSHPNLLSFRGVCVDLTEKSWNLHILMDFCDAGSLNRLICNRQERFGWHLRYSLARDISYAMDFMHAKKIMHRDLTSMNVLLQTVDYGYLKAVVADFGLSCKVPKSGDKLPQVGTPFWMAPECLKEEFYDEKADVFSFGIILCQMVARIDSDPEAGLYRTHNFGLDHIRFTALCPSDTPSDFLNIAFQCCLSLLNHTQFSNYVHTLCILNMNPVSRPSFTSLYHFFTKFLLSSHLVDDGSPLQSIENDGRLGRSWSDASLGYSKPKQSELSFILINNGRDTETRNQSKSMDVVPFLVFKDVPCKSILQISEIRKLKRENQMHKLARSIAMNEFSEEISLDTVNPFVTHEIYGTARKLTSVVATSQKICELSDEQECNNNKFDEPDMKYCFTNHERIVAQRSISLPSSATNLISVKPCVNFRASLPSLSAKSSPTVCGQCAKTDEISQLCVLKGQMSMAFKYEDQKFTSRQYLSTFFNRTLFSGVSANNQRRRDLSLLMDEAILNCDSSGFDLERWKNDISFANFLQQQNDVVTQQPFPVCPLTNESSRSNNPKHCKVSVWLRSTIIKWQIINGMIRDPYNEVGNASSNQKANECIKFLRESSATSVKHIEKNTIQNTVVLDTGFRNDTATLNSFCVSSSRYESCCKQRLAHIGDRHVTSVDKHCSVL